MGLIEPVTLKTDFSTKNWFITCFAAGTLAFFGCGKKKEAPQTAQTPSTAAPEQTAPAPGTPTPATPTASTPPPAPATDSYESVVTARAIDYLQGQVVRKSWPQARLALKQVEGRSLTPEQRKYVDGLKAQIPPG